MKEQIFSCFYLSRKGTNSLNYSTSGIFSAIAPTVGEPLYANLYVNPLYSEDHAAQYRESTAGFNIAEDIQWCTASHDSLYICGYP